MDTDDCLCRTERQKAARKAENSGIQGAARPTDSFRRARVYIVWRERLSSDGGHNCNTRGQLRRGTVRKKLCG